MAEEMMEFLRQQRPRAYTYVVARGFKFEGKNITIVDTTLHPFVN